MPTIGFVAPRRNAAALTLARWLAPSIAKRGAGIVRVDLPRADRERLAAHRGRATLLTCNHPSQHEPVVVFMAAAKAGLAPWFMAGRRMFGRLSAPAGWLVRGAGAFSVRRDAFDPGALRAARGPLGAGDALVVFPEGETYRLGSALLPFQEGNGAPGPLGAGGEAPA